jgi:hypothetical protein
MDKKTEITKCLSDIQRLGMDMAGLEACNLDSADKALLKLAFTNLDNLVTNLNAMLHPQTDNTEVANA